MKNNKYVILFIRAGIMVCMSFTLLLLIGKIGLDSRTASHKKQIEEKIHISLPDNSLIKKYSSSENGGYFGAIISISAENVEGIKKQLSSYLNEVTPEQIPHYDVYTHFFDLNQKINSIEAMYTRVVGAETSSDPWSREIWVFITKEKDGNYFVYIAY